MTKSQGLGFILIVGVLVLVTRWATVDGFPPLSLHEPLPPEQDNSWSKMFGDGPPSVEARATLSRLGERRILFGGNRCRPGGVDEMGARNVAEPEIPDHVVTMCQQRVQRMRVRPFR